jgi:hypothetical protein
MILDIFTMGEIGQPPSERKPITIDSELVH